MIKSCPCGNIVITLDSLDNFTVARTCGCDYCSSNNAEYLSDPETVIGFTVIDRSKHQVIKHGHNTADFHECANCGLVLATTAIDGDLYGILNAPALGITGYKLESLPRDYSSESVEARLERRKVNWCPAITCLV